MALFLGSGLLIAVFGSLVLEDKFTKPADALVNAFFVLVSLAPLVAKNMDFLLCVLLGYTLVVLFSGFINLALLRRDLDDGVISFCRERSSEIATTFGKSKLIHSFLFLYAVHAVNTSDNSYSVLLLLFWAVHLAMWPLKLPHILDAFLVRRGLAKTIGTIVRVEVPNIVKVRLDGQSSWKGEMFAALGDGSTRKILPSILNTGRRSDWYWIDFRNRLPI